MPTQRLILNAAYQAQPLLMLTPAQLLARHFWGLPTCNNQGREIPESLIKQKIIDSQIEVENYFGIKLFAQLIRENVEYNAEQFNNYGFVRVSYNIQKVYELQGIYGQQPQVELPRNWLSIRRETSSVNNHSQSSGNKHFNVIPNGGGTITTAGVIYGGPYSANNMRSSANVPNYWYATYLTGYTHVPNDLINLVEKLAAIQVFSQLGDSFLAVGVSSQSISLDGLSQSMNTIRNAEGNVYAPRMKQYVKELADKMDELRGKYRGVVFDML